MTKNKTSISFIKVGIGKDKRRIPNELNIVKFAETYNGTEEGDTNIVYTRIS